MLFPDAQDGEEPNPEAEHPPQCPWPLGARPSSQGQARAPMAVSHPGALPSLRFPITSPGCSPRTPTGTPSHDGCPTSSSGTPHTPQSPLGSPPSSPGGAAPGVRCLAGTKGLRSEVPLCAPGTWRGGREGWMERSFRRGSKKAARSEQERAGARRQQVKPRGEQPPPPGPVPLPPWVGGGP